MSKLQVKKKPKKSQTGSKSAKLTKIIVLCEKLGNTPGKIAKTLQRLNITGEIGDSDSCPIAKYYRANGCHSVHVLPEGLCNRTWHYIYGWPKCTSDFIRRFDNRYYPKLIDDIYLPLYCLSDG